MSENADERPFPGSAAGNAAGAQGNVAHAASLRGSSGRILPLDLTESGKRTLRKKLLFSRKIYDIILEE
jgi:hypothetical protein